MVRLGLHRLWSAKFGMDVTQHPWESGCPALTGLHLPLLKECTLLSEPASITISSNIYQYRGRRTRQCARAILLIAINLTQLGI